MNSNVNKTVKRLSKSFVLQIVAEAVEVTEATAEDETTQEIAVFGILFAPVKCPKNYKLYGKTCRRAYD